MSSEASCRHEFVRIVRGTISYDGDVGIRDGASVDTWLVRRHPVAAVTVSMPTFVAMLSFGLGCRQVEPQIAVEYVRDIGTDHRHNERKRQQHEHPWRCHHDTELVRYEHDGDGIWEHAYA